MTSASEGWSEVFSPKDRTLESSDIEKFSMRLIDTMKRIGLELRS